MSVADGMALDPSDLDDLDRAILDYLQEGREEGEPWGIATPAVTRAALQDRGWSESELPVRQTFNNRMKDMALAGHLRNLYDKGVYEFVSDPREG